MFQAINLDFDYPDKPVLKGINFTLQGAHLLHIKGNNGAGKTTLLKVLVGLYLPTQGDIKFNGISIYQDLITFHQSICYVGHKNGLSPFLSVREFWQFELKKKDCFAFDCLIQKLALEGLEDIPCGLLSLGQQRRVSLLRLLLAKVPIWFLDEPLSALDETSVEILMGCILEHLDQNGSVILTSHQNLPMNITRYQEYCL